MRSMSVTGGQATALWLMIGCNYNGAAQTSAPETRTAEVAGNVDRVKVSGALMVDIAVGDTFDLKMTGAPEDLDTVIVNIDGSTVDLSRKHKRRLGNGGEVRLDLVLPRLRGIEVSGASELRFKGFSHEGEFTADLSGASEVIGEDLELGTLTLEMSGASEVALAGQASQCRLEGSGASEAELLGLTCNDWSVELSGASEAKIHAKRTLGPVDLSGAADLTYAGDPKLGRIDKSGASDLDRD